MLRKIMLASALLLAATAAWADGPTSDELEKRIQELESRLEAISQENASPELDEIRRQIEILSREIEALKLQQNKTVAVADQEQYGLGAAASKVYRSEPGFSFGGYGEMLYESFDDTRDDGSASGKTNQLDFLRAILYAGYKFNDKVIFNSEIEFEHATTSGSVGEVSVEFAYLDFLVRDELNVRAGMVLLPVGFVNELHEPTAFLGARRPQVEQQIIPSTWRENGLGVFGDFGDFTYRAYIVNGFDSAKFSSSGVRSGRQKGGKAKADDLAIVGRLDWEPFEGLMFGGSVYTGDSAQGRTTPGGESFGANVTMTELHGEWKWRGLQARALWVETSIDDVRELNEANGLTGAKSVGEEQDGWYAEAGFDLASVMNLGKHSLIPYVRFEDYDTQKVVPAGYLNDPKTAIEILTIGFAWKPIPQAVIKIDFQDIDDGAGSGTDQFNAALGYIF
jgi:hypothetical protein